MMKNNYQKFAIISVTLILVVIATAAGIGDIHDSQSTAFTFSAEKENGIPTASDTSALQATTPTAASTATVIRIGSSNPGQVSFVLLNTTGTLASDFSTDGIKTEFITFGTDSDVINALTEGSIDIAYTSADPALIASAGGADIRLIGLASSNPVSPSAIIAGINDTKIFRVQDLKGKKVAYLNGTENQAFLYRALNNAGLSFKNITPVNIDYTAAYSRLQSKDIDAIVVDYNTVYGKVSYDAEVKGSIKKVSAKVITTGKEHPAWAQPAVITVNGNFAKNYPGYVKRLLAVDSSESAWADANYQKTVKVLANATKQTESAILKTYPAGVFYLDPTITDSALASLKTEEKFLNQTGQITGPIDWNTLVTTTYL
ncbi:MAG: aliphatic sulfonate ABC transporter substrate-binding protein [Methanoregula sp.]|nr:aliphatic sulfonate ABC transporter substrate-binding protein [Methanoregula sp.]